MTALLNVIVEVVKVVLRFEIYPAGDFSHWNNRPRLWQGFIVLIVQR